VSRLKKTLPVIRQEPVPAPATSLATSPREESAVSAPGSVTLDGAEQTVVRVEGMDCAGCAATVEKRVAA